MLQPIAVFVTFLGLLVILIRVFRHFDRLLQIEFNRYPHQWLEDGASWGFFWKPPDASGSGSVMARHRLSLTWIFKTPAWMENDSEAQANLKQFRFYCLAWNLGIIAWFLLFLPRG